MSSYRSRLKDDAAHEFWLYVGAQYKRALEDLNGVLLNEEGHRHAREHNWNLEIDIFTCHWPTAQRFASEELLQWWQENGRETLLSFRWQMHGWPSDRKHHLRVQRRGHSRVTERSRL